MERCKKFLTGIDGCSRATVLRSRRIFFAFLLTPSLLFTQNASISIREITVDTLDVLVRKVAAIYRRFRESGSIAIRFDGKDFPSRDFFTIDQGESHRNRNDGACEVDSLHG
jgi:hypothetical protein